MVPPAWSHSPGGAGLQHLEGQALGAGGRVHTLKPAQPGAHLLLASLTWTGGAGVRGGVQRRRISRRVATWERLQGARREGGGGGGEGHRIKEEKGPAESLRPHIPPGIFFVPLVMEE